MKQVPTSAEVRIVSRLDLASRLLCVVNLNNIKATLHRSLDSG